MDTAEQIGCCTSGTGGEGWDRQLEKGEWDVGAAVEVGGWLRAQTGCSLRTSLRCTDMVVSLFMACPTINFAGD